MVRASASILRYAALVAILLVGAYHWRPVLGLSLLVVVVYWADAVVFRRGLEKALTVDGSGRTWGRAASSDSATAMRRRRRWWTASAATVGLGMTATIDMFLELSPERAASAELESLREQIEYTGGGEGARSRGVERSPEAMSVAIESLLDSDLPRATAVTLRHDAGVYFYATGDLDRAIELFRDVIERDVTNADSHFNIGRILQRKGRHEEAIEAFEQARRFDADNADATYWIGVSRHILGQPEEAKAAFEEARDKFPADSKWRRKCEESLDRLRQRD